MRQAPVLTGRIRTEKKAGCKMSVMSKHHQELTNGVGKCSVPMWSDGCPSGFCDEPAYGFRPDCETFRDAYTGEVKRLDGRYNGYVPGLACPKHGGPKKTEDEDGQS
jgi:hypothetical protein